MDVLYLIKKETYRRGYSQKTTLTYCQCVKQFLRFCHKDIKRITKKDVREYLDTLKEKGLTGSTLNVHLNSLMLHNIY